MSEDHVSEQQFLLEFFGNDGRELGNPPYDGRKRYFTSNPDAILECIDFATKNKLPAFQSVQPFTSFGKLMGIEKLFFDFDYADKTEIKELEKKETDPIKFNEIISQMKTELEQEVKNFIIMLTTKRSINKDLKPMIVKTRKGYHIYIYFDRVYIFEDISFAKEVYRTLKQGFRRSYTGYFGQVNYLDGRVDEDAMRMARIPLSIHEKSGEKCKLIKLNNNLKFEDDKVRSVNFYKNYNLKESDIRDAIKETKIRLENQAVQRQRMIESMKNNTTRSTYSGIRPCFQKAIESKEMHHQQRLAFLLELWWNANVRNFDDLMKYFTNFNDFNEKKTKDQLDFFFKHEVYNKYSPYSCETLQKYGCCLESNECKKWKEMNK